MGLLLVQTGDDLLKEDGDVLLVESLSVPGGELLKEDGFNLLTEAGDLYLLQQGGVLFSPSSGHTVGTITVTASYSGGALSSASNPFAIVSGPGTGLTSYVQVDDTTATFQFTQTSLSGTPVIFSDSVTGLEISFATVPDVPGAPTIGTASVTGYHSASVDGSAPADDGGASVTLYTAISTPGSIQGTSATLPVAVTGLDHGVTYTFKLYATNAAGIGTGSVASNSLILTADRTSESVLIDNTLPGAPALSDSQFQIELTSEHVDLFLDAYIDGSDIVIVDGASVMDFWIETYDPIAQVAEIWVKTPASWLAQGASKTIYLVYGNTGYGVGNASYDDTLQKFDHTDSATVACWHFDEGTGTSIVDATGNYTATLTGGVMWDSEDGGNFADHDPVQIFAAGSQLSFNGSNVITVPGLGDTPTNSGSIRFWFQPEVDNPTSGYLFSKNAASGKGIFGDFDSDGKLRIRRYVNFGVPCALKSRRSTWSSAQRYRIVLTWSPSMIALYVNGRLEYATPQVPTTGGTGKWGAGSADPFAFGALYAGSASNYFRGKIDEIVITSRYAIPEEVHADFHRRKWQLGQEQSGRWARQGMVYDRNPSAGTPDDKLMFEPTVLNFGPTDWRLWYSGWSTTGTFTICYATSTNGTSWTRYGSNPVIPNVSLQSCTMRDLSGTFHNYAADSASTHIQHRTSADGIAWSAPTAVITKGVQGYCSTSVHNPMVWQEDATHWYMLLEGFDGARYLLGLFTSPDGVNWGADTDNPIQSLRLYSDSQTSGPTLVTVNGVYYLWYHVDVGELSAGITIGGASNIACAKSTDKKNWTILGGGDPVAIIDDESSHGSVVNQIADPSILEVGGQTYLYYEANATDLVTDIADHFELRKFAGSIAQLIPDSPVITFGTVSTPFGFSDSDLEGNLLAMEGF